MLPGLPWLSTEIEIQKRCFAGAAPDQVGEEAALGRRLTLSPSGLSGCAWAMNDSKHKKKDIMWEQWEAKGLSILQLEERWVRLAFWLLAELEVMSQSGTYTSDEI